MKKVDISTWNRQEHYTFFRPYTDPFFNVTALVDVTQLQADCKANGYSFFLACLHNQMRAVQQVDAFRMRLKGPDVVLHEEVHGGCTILLDDKTFNFCFFPWTSNYKKFEHIGQAQIAERKQNPKLYPHSYRDDIIFYSVLPWLHFTSFTNARSDNPDDSVPRIVWGKYKKYDSQLLMPVSVEVHHALVDGYHVGLFFEHLQNELNKPLHTVL